MCDDTKDFNKDEHISCHQCGFEAIYVDVLTKQIFYVKQDGTLDIETATKDDYSKPDDVPGLVCNSRRCGVSVKPEEGIRWRLWCPCCQKNHNLTKKLRKASDLAGNAVTYDQALTRIHALCDSCISLHTWKDL
jgi:hypothetical protein